ncbi:oxidoreductase alpha (molybdopterin) subunit [Stappia sp. 22II-S9-Z10]|nr:oxidoreductase alpha (molybdopterin) subunit [Stappia sp. 22II-S9-Z10]
MPRRERIGLYTHPAGGWNALVATGRALTEQRAAHKCARTLRPLNQPEGFDCPSCAWPDPKHTSSFELCENGAKAVAWDATERRCTPEPFAAHRRKLLTKIP